jgi:GTP cyclohydrolase FolE2
MEVRAAAGAEGEPDGIWIDDLVAVAEGVASAPLYPLLKRSDEKFVTEQAYDNPRFVEDMVRGVAVCLQQDSRVAWFWTKVVNQESIHNHVAWAQYEWTRPHE